MTDTDQPSDDYLNPSFDEDGKDCECPYCKGTGYVNPLTAPPDFFCVSTTECPACDGSGEI
jgi:DnaJ-class molecular chaperone